MKNSIRLALFLFFVSFASFAQQKEKLTYYVGVGPAIDGNIGLYGLNFSNELSFKIGKKAYLNPSLTYYQSLSTVENFKNTKLEDDNSSGLFTNVTFRYDVIKTKDDFKISLAFGPSFQIGSESYFSGGYFVEGPNGEEDYYDYNYQIDKFSRLGFTQQIIFDWKSKNENRRNSALISMSSFGGYWPWYLMATYRMGFKLK